MNTLKIIFSSVLIIGISGLIFGQSAGNSIYNNTYYGKINTVNTNVNLNQHRNNQAELKAEVMINVKASSYTAIFGVTQHGLTAKETNAFMTERIKLVKKQLLEQVGIKKGDVHVDVISFVPTYSLQLENIKFSKSANEIPSGFQMKKNIHVVFYDHDQLSEIVAIMANSEIYDIVKVDYNADNIQEIYNRLREEAIQVIKNKQKTYEQIGLHLEVMNLADGFDVAYPFERYASSTAYFTGSSIEEVELAKKRKRDARRMYKSGKNGRTKSRTIDDGDDSEYIIRKSHKNKTIYYNRVPYNQFDMVLNADFSDTRIQFFYTLKVMYTTSNLEKHLEMKKVKAQRTDLMIKHQTTPTKRKFLRRN